MRQGVRHRAQQLVAAWRGMRIVAIDLDMDQRRIATVVAQACNLANQALAQMPRVWQAGQRIVAELPAQALGGASFGNVAKHHHGPGGASVAGQRQDRVFDRYSAAIAAPEHGFDLVHRHAIGIGATQGRAARRLLRMDRGLGEQADQVVVIAIAEQAQPGRVDETDAAITIDAEHAIANRTEDAVELLALHLRRAAHLDGARQRADARQEQLARFVLEHAFAGTGLQAAADDVLAIAAGDHRQDGRILALAQALAQLVAAAVRQEIVDDDEIVVVLRGQLVGLGDGGGDIDRITIAFEHVAVGQAYALGIIDKEDADALDRFGRRRVRGEIIRSKLDHAVRDAAELRPQQEASAQGGRHPLAHLGGFLMRHQQRCRCRRRVAGEFEQGLVLARRPRGRTDDGQRIRWITTRRTADAAQVIEGFQVVADFRAHRQPRRVQRAAQQMIKGGRSFD